MAKARSAHSRIISMIDKNFLECSICARPFHDPRALPCLHAFCAGCLEKWAKTCSKDNSTVSCPLCKKVYQIPEEEGIKGFPAHFLVTNLQNTVVSAKQGTLTPDLCENHGEKKVYYCKNCDCAACSDCSVLDLTHRGHAFIKLDQAATQQSRSLEDLTSRVQDVEKKYVTAVQQIKQAMQDLDKSAEVKIKAIKEARNEHMKQVNNLVTAYEQEIYRKKQKKKQTANKVLAKLQCDLATVTHACKLTSNVVESGSHADINTLYPSLSTKLQQLAQSQPSTLDITLSQIQLEPLQRIPVSLSSLEHLICNKLLITPPNQQISVRDESRHMSARSAIRENLPPATAKPTPTSSSSAKPITVTTLLPPVTSRASSTSAAAKYVQKPESGNSWLSRHQPAPSTLHWKKWKASGEINTQPEAGYPCDIAIDPKGHIAVTSTQAPVTVFSMNGTFKSVLEDSPSDVLDIAITPSNQYIIPDKAHNIFYIYDNQGVLVRAIPTYDINGKQSTPNSVAVDSVGTIIVGLGNKTMSVHQPDGTFILKFETKSSPHKLTCAPDDKLVISFCDHTLQEMDQSGQSVSIIQPPPGIQSWKPAYVCCGKTGELFVGNWGDTCNGVYRYASTGGEYKYLDCITSMEHSPYGIALSADEEYLFVADYVESVIKVFQ